MISALALSKSVNTKEIKSGKSLKLDQNFLGDDIPPFKYWPTDEKFWNYYESLVKDQEFDRALNLSQRQIERFGDDSLEGAEGKLAVAQTLLKKGYSYISFVLLIQLAGSQIGSRIGEAAIYELSLLTKDFIYEKRALDNFINTNEFKGLHPYAQSFVSYHKGMRAMTFGYDKWTKKYLSEIEPRSYWAYLFKYWSAVGEVPKGKMESAKQMFSSLYTHPKVEDKLKDLAGLQLARIEFEGGNFSEAYRIYSQLTHLSLRERGRIQLERAWTQYYTRNYSKSLGLLTALRAPLFRHSLSPEQFVLEMLIYRDLCHYQSTSLVAKDFHRAYKRSISSINKRISLNEDKKILDMVLMNKDIQDEANLIDLIRKERKKVREDKVSYHLLKGMNGVLDSYKETDKRLQMVIDFKTKDQSRQVASDLLDSREQILFLDYRSKIDNSKISPKRGGRGYTSSKIPYMTFDRIYWPVQNLFGVTEYWTNEFEDYNMLISSRCHETKKEQRPEEKRIEREFK